MTTSETPARTLRAAAWIASVLPTSARRALYRLGPVSGAIRSVLTQAAPRGLTRVRIAAGPLADMEMKLDLRAEKDLWLGTYEPDFIRAIASFVSPGDTVYDVGANIGYLSLAMARAVGDAGHVVAFEPLPLNVERLHSNLSLNSEGRRVQVVGAAAGERTSKGQFLVHSSGGMGKLDSAAGRQEHYQDSIAIEVVALDDWIREAPADPPTLVKIDVEGGEALTLAGLRQTLERDRPILLMELHGPEAIQATREILSEANYSLHGMVPGSPEITRFADWKVYAVGRPPSIG